MNNDLAQQIADAVLGTANNVVETADYKVAADMAIKMNEVLQGHVLGDIMLAIAMLTAAILQNEMPDQRKRDVMIAALATIIRRGIVVTRETLQ